MIRLFENAVIERSRNESIDNVIKIDLKKNQQSNNFSLQ